ncbi:potassium channel family protein [Pseudothermotoga thermarum]|uniref:potassium channel family protein n=1 Tax=Pseudothermotoga thermarum TaxID=119394 RepID=UPI0002DEDC5E|nr:potassium channel family protein [Pseudothermotoga thermarum]
MKLGRYSEALQTIGKSMYCIENAAQPDTFSSIPAAMWWAIVTLTTVGYGDVYPVTLFGRFLAAVIALLGIGLFSLPAGILAAGFVEELRRKKKSREGIICPHCGKKIDYPPNKD